MEGGAAHRARSFSPSLFLLFFCIETKTNSNTHKANTKTQAATFAPWDQLPFISGLSADVFVGILNVLLGNWRATNQQKNASSNYEAQKPGRVASRRWDWNGCNLRELCECKMNGEVGGVKVASFTWRCLFFVF